jgi:HD-GYP domain-containing protein (c-di-GMP phosphodiesterase class II)/ribonuclease BN (tRNA processing enzyme)
MRITFYGTRGSVPVGGTEHRRYGGATTCCLLTFGQTNIMVDAGSGATSALRDLDCGGELYLFITHPHLDHLSGIVSLIPAFGAGRLHIYGRPRGGLSVKEQVARVMSPPLWPVCADGFGSIDWIDVPEGEFEAGGVRVSSMESNHPGGCTLYRFGTGDESVVTAFDFNHAGGFGDRLAEFAAGARLLVYDGSMSAEEYEEHPDWGHSVPQIGAQIAARTGSRLIITHHSPGDDDRLLAESEEKLAGEYPGTVFAADGMTVDVTGGEVTVRARTERERDILSCLLDVGIMLSTEKNPDYLLEKITRAAIYITGADGGTLYTCGKECLEFRIMITKSKDFFKGGRGDPIDLPPVPMKPDSVCTAAVLERRLINIPDVYDDRRFDFSGPRRYDALNGYRTQSILVVPMVNDRDDVIGVMQLINATDLEGHVIPFPHEDEAILSSIASQAAISLTNMNYSKQIVELLNGFVKVMSNGIDARTPYNANHTRNMVKYGERFFDYEKRTGGKWDVSDNERSEILMSVWLHDVGKLITPLEIMDKATRLGSGIDAVRARFGRAKLLNRLDRAEGRIDGAEFERRAAELDADLALVETVNTAGFLPDDRLAAVNALREKTYVEEDGSAGRLITDVEFGQLSVRKGTLTDEERAIMQSHVSMTSRMLSGLTFPKDYVHVPEWAGSHHELLNGSGYPRHLTGDGIPWEVRLITILDVFEALTARDRPYKPPMPAERALGILDSMVKDGQVDAELLGEFKLSGAWED